MGYKEGQGTKREPKILEPNSETPHQRHDHLRHSHLAIEKELKSSAAITFFVHHTFPNRWMSIEFNS